MLKMITYIMTGATIVIFIKVFSGQVPSPPPGQGAPEVLWALPIITIILWALCGYRYRSKSSSAPSDVIEQNDMVSSVEKEDMENTGVEAGDGKTRSNTSAAEWYEEGSSLYNDNKKDELMVVCFKLMMLYPRSKEAELARKNFIK